MKWKSGYIGGHIFKVLPKLGWDDASIWFVWLWWFLIFERD